MEACATHLGQFWYDLLVIMDDATSEIYYAQLVEEELTRTVMSRLRAVIEQQGVFCALYTLEHPV